VAQFDNGSENTLPNFGLTQGVISYTLDLGFSCLCNALVLSSSSQVAWRQVQELDELTELIARRHVSVSNFFCFMDGINLVLENYWRNQVHNALGLNIGRDQ
jgi:hypothetical protein